jgi:hypothetical protein
MKRCQMMSSGDIAGLLREAHEAQTARVAKATAAASAIPVTFSKTAKAAALAAVGEVGRACKVAFTYGMETDPEVAAKVLSRLNRSERHTHITPHVSTVIPAKDRIHVLAVTEAFTRMPKKSAAHRDGWT